MQNHVTYTGEQKIRLDLFLTQEFENQKTRSFWQKMIKHGYVSINNTVVKMPNTILKEQCSIDIAWPTDRPSAIEIPILYEDKDVVVIDKPAGVLTHSKGAFNPEFTVSDFAKTKATDDFEGDRPGIVHRLDRVTSGVMILAKNESALTHLQKQFSNRKAKKVYIAVCERIIDNDKYHIDLPIARNPKQPQTFRVHQSGKNAITDVLVRNRGTNYTVVELRPHTGRTHQLRVHLSHIAHPIVGDTLYGAQEKRAHNRILLHSSQLEVTLPSKKRETFIAQLPEDMSSYIHGS